MPIGYFRNEARHHIRLTFEGTIEPEHLRILATRLVQEGTWRYPRLCEMRNAVQRSSLAALQVLLSYAPAEVSQEKQTCGPIAIVVNHPMLFPEVRRFATALGTAQLIEVFDDAEEAAQWLSVT